MTPLKWWKGNYQPQILCPVKLDFQDEGKNKAFIRQQKKRNLSLEDQFARKNVCNIIYS